MAQAAGKGALIGGGLRLTFKVYEEYKQGKNPFKGEYSAEDWKEIGIETVKGAAVGGIAASAIYALTNFASLCAPFAGSFVSTSQVIASLVNSLNSGGISFDQFTELSQLACVESAAALASALGQAVVPIPVLGAVLGTIAGRIAIDFSKKYFGEETKQLKRQLDEYYNQCLAKIDSAYRAVILNIIAEYEKLGSLTKAAFDEMERCTLVISNRESIVL